MKKGQLEIYASQIEMELYQIAFNEVRFREVFDNLIVFQSFCYFNLFWLYSIAPEVVLHIETVEFFLNNRNHLKRKLTIKEMLKYDLIFGIYKPETFNEFKKHVTQ